MRLQGELAERSRQDAFVQSCARIPRGLDVRLRAFARWEFTRSDVMHVPDRRIEQHPALRGASPPALLARIRSWAGRVALSWTTASPLPLHLTAGTHRTRVSELRLMAARIGQRSRHGAPTDVGITASQRRMSSGSSPSEGMT